MIKKIFIFLFFIILLSSCGKKGDPIYNEENQNSGTSSASQSTV